jgi:hypothetical protein
MIRASIEDASVNSGGFDGRYESSQSMKPQSSQNIDNGIENQGYLLNFLLRHHSIPGVPLRLFLGIWSIYCAYHVTPNHKVAREIQ